MNKILLIAFALFYSSYSWAGTCTAKISRECPPEKKCRTSETRTEVLPNIQECLSYAKKLCPVYFSEGVSKKEVRAQFDGKPLASDKNICQ